MGKTKWFEDQEYMSYVENLLQTTAVQRLDNYQQHHHTTRLEHSIRVSYMSYCLAKKLKLDAKAVARAGILHDLFYYDWRVTKFDRGTHAWIHPRIALRNAEKLTQLTPLEKDIIIKHMWGATLCPPKHLEGVIVSLVDKYSATQEYTSHLRSKWSQVVAKRTMH